MLRHNEIIYNRYLSNTIYYTAIIHIVQFSPRLNILIYVRCCVFALVATASVLICSCLPCRNAKFSDKKKKKKKRERDKIYD